MEQDITLNIHYTAPKEIWDAIGKVYESMPYWQGYDKGPHWKDENEIDLVAQADFRYLAPCRMIYGKYGTWS